MSVSNIWSILKKTVSDFSDDRAMTFAAAVAFYSALSLAPLLLLFITLVGTLGEGAEDQLIAAINNFVGGTAGGAVEMIANNEDTPTLTSLTGLIGFATLLFSASGVFAQLQAALNHMWDVQAAPGSGVWGWLRKRFLSVGMIFVILFLLLLSVVATSFLSAAGNQVTNATGAAPVEEAAGVIWQIVNAVVSLIVFFVLFVLMFKFLPDVRIGWKDVLVGSAVTAVLFLIGKFAIGIYLAQGGAGSAYGAAGSLIALLIWVYYSTVILFFGAELTQAIVRGQGRRIEPDEHAEFEPTAPEVGGEKGNPA
jgi:membrane protein